MALTRRFLYSLKLHDGQLLHVEGESPEDAARAAGVEIHRVKRSLPVKKILTEEERQAQIYRLTMLRRKSLITEES